MTDRKEENQSKQNKLHSHTVQAKTNILAYLESPHLHPGDSLPSERQLSEMFKISRVTVRKLLTEIEAEGLIHRLQGKGTFISQAKYTQSTSELTSFSEDMKRRELKPGSLILDFKKMDASLRMITAFQFKEHQKHYLLRRLRLASGKPMTLENCYLPESIGDKIAPFIRNNISLYEVIAQHCHLEVYRASQTVEVGSLNQWERDLLQTSRESCCFLITRRSFDQNGNLIEYVQSKYRGDRYFLTMDLIRKHAD